jgi:hypothetical protein
MTYHGRRNEDTFLKQVLHNSFLTFLLSYCVCYCVCVCVTVCVCVLLCMCVCVTIVSHWVLQ